MKTLQEIEARLAEIAGEVEKRGADISAEDLAAFEKEVNELKEARAKLLAAVEQRNGLLTSIAEGRSGASVVRTFPSPAAPTGGEQRNDADPLDTMEYRRAFMNYALRGTPIPAEFRADAISKTAENSAVIPTTILNTIIEKMEAVGMILPLVTRTAYKGGVSIPTSTAKPVATWVAEGAGSDKQKKTTGSITFAYHKLRCAVAVSLEMDTMALSAFEATLINNVVEAMTKALEAAIVATGDGSGKPKAILAETVPSGQTITSAAPSYEDLINAEAALPQAYENGAVWCMSKKTFMQYYGLVDETGQPIGRINYGIAGKPERALLGRPVVVCDYVPSVAAAASGKAFAFLFNFKDYVLNTNYAMTVKKYEDNDTDDMVTKAIMLVDGKVVDANSLVVIAKSA